MSGSEHASVDADDDRVAVTAGGVHVSKWLTETGSAVPIVKYEIRSVREDDARVALTDRVPDGLDLDDVGFHDEYRGEDWQHAGAHAIRFEAELPAGETVTTVYGVRQEAIEDPSTFLARPELAISAATDASDAPEGTVAGSEGAFDVADDGLRSTLSLADPSEDGSEGDAADGLDSAGIGEDETDSAATIEDETDSAATIEDETDSAAGAGGVDDDAMDGVAAPSILETAANDGEDESGETRDADAAVVERFVAALQSDAVDAETRAALGQALNVQLSASTSQFVEHLQSRAKAKRGQLEADLESLEDSVAELYGTKADASTLASVDARTADAETVRALASDVTELADAKADADALKRVRDALETLDDAAAMESDLEAAEGAFEDEVAALRADLEALEASAATADALEDVVDDVESLDRRTPALDAFQSLRADHDDLESTVGDVDAALEAETDALAADLEAESASLADDIDAEAEALRSEVDDLETQLSERLERERTEVDDELAALRDSKADAAALSDASARVDELAASKADADRVAAVESTLEAEYVTEDDITDAVEARLRRSLLSRTLLVAGGAAAGGGTALVASGVTAGGALVVAALAAFAYWYWLQRHELAPKPSASERAGEDRDDETAPPELAAAEHVAVEDDETGTEAVDAEDGSAEAEAVGVEDDD
ncbi:hypothetical protein [Halorubellus sp. PRR65]|uniref:hypothetical protein n=1 Tax=Halorubellus sp. PRR65 TaxID=3098148 RepID=UPI002B258E9F|nr:hypothetical protein [Halorubellus sp. PRR65]